MVTQIFAHRGLHTHERENTVAAFLAARAQGVDGVELDVRRTVDGALVIHHDPRCEGMDISSTRQRDLPTYVPTLDDAMESCEGMRVNVEIKNNQDRSETSYDETGELARQVVRHLQQINWTDRVIISSFDQATCANARSFDADIDVGWLLWNVDLASAITQAHILGFTAVHPNFKELNPAAMMLAREMDLLVNTWTVNTRTALRAMIELEVNAVITDRPVRAKTLLSGTSSD
jgi:glycerophosphoryl diester phosphodiesterase